VVLYWEGCAYPIEVYAGDILFIAGCELPVDRARKLAFEHVAVAAENRRVSVPLDWLDLPVYSMPESSRYAAASLTPGISIATGRYWQNRRFAGLIGKTIGSDQTIWNLVCRESSVDRQMAEYVALELAQCEGSFDCSYQSVFQVDPSLSSALRTNCLGFACSVLEHFGFQIVARRYPQYENPYSSSGASLRDFPSPGHLARALHAILQRPYLPSNPGDAVQYARADVTLDEVANPRRGCLWLI
jgi:hypothetical protein